MTFFLYDGIKLADKAKSGKRGSTLENNTRQDLTTQGILSRGPSHEDTWPSRPSGESAKIPSNTSLPSMTKSPKSAF